MLQVRGTYYWYGVNYEGAASYAANPSNSNSDTNFVAITTSLKMAWSPQLLLVPYCISATNILGPYGAEVVVGNTDLDFSHVTQTGLFITVKGTAQSTVIFGGDRWSDFAGNGIGFNDWTPLTFNGTTPVMASMSEWSINATAGTWSVGPGNNYVLNPSFEADRVATNPPAGWTTSNGADVTSTHSGNFAWQLSAASSVDQKIASLPSGTYTLTVWANGTCEVGASTTGGTVTLDDFALIKS